MENILHAILCNNPTICYYQGFHDICLVFLLTLGEHAGFVAAEKATLFFLRDSTAPTLQPVVETLSLLIPLIQIYDPQLGNFLVQADTKPFFALSWMITWFAHDVEKLSDVQRIFDFFLANHPLMPLYLSAAVVMSQKQELLAGECDGTLIHGYLSKILKKMRFDFDHLVLIADRLFRLHGPKELQELAKIKLSKFSCTNCYSDDWKQFEANTQAAIEQAAIDSEKNNNSTNGSSQALVLKGKAKPKWTNYALYAVSMTVSALAAFILTESLSQM